MHRGRVAVEAARRRPGHVVAKRGPGRGEQRRQLLVAHLVAGAPGIEAHLPERLALVHVADPAAHPLVEQQLAQRHRAGRPRPGHDLVEWEVVAERVRAEVADRLAAVAHQLQDRRREAHRLPLLEREDDPREVPRPAPALAGPVEVPRAGHAHVRVQGPAAAEAHQQVLADRLDGLQPPADQALEPHRRGGPDGPAADALPQPGGGAPDGVALRHGGAVRGGLAPDHPNPDHGRLRADPQEPALGFLHDLDERFLFAHAQLRQGGLHGLLNALGATFDLSHPWLQSHRSLPRPEVGLRRRGPPSARVRKK